MRKTAPGMKPRLLSLPKTLMHTHRPWGICMS